MDNNCHHCDSEITDDNYGSKMRESDHVLCKDCFDEITNNGLTEKNWRFDEIECDTCTQQWVAAYHKKCKKIRMP